MSDVEKDLVELLREHQGGTALHRATRLLGELVDAVLEQDKGGSLTIKIGVKPFGEDGTSVAATVDVIAAPPRPAAGTSVFYARQGSLWPYADDEPTQPELSEATVEALAVHSSDEETDKRERRSA